MNVWIQMLDVNLLSLDLDLFREWIVNKLKSDEFQLYPEFVYIYTNQPEWVTIWNHMNIFRDVVFDTTLDEDASHIDVVWICKYSS